MAKVADSSVPNKEIDGWIMSPQGPNHNCVAVPPGANTLATAKGRSVQAESPCCQARRAAGANPRDIIYVNGISTDKQAHCRTLNLIAAQTCARVVGVYNATESKLADAAQTGQDRRLIKAAASRKCTPAVDTLARAVADEVEAGRPPEIWANSQGGAVTSLALYEANNDLGVLTGEREALKGVSVKSFGSAAPQWIDGPKYEHYIHVNDFTPTLFGLGHDGARDAASAGNGAKVIRFSGDPAKPGPFETSTIIKDFLPAPTSNHSIDDTYLRMEKQKNGGCP